MDDLLKGIGAWELLTKLHLEFIDNKLFSSNVKYHNQSFIWTTVNLSKSVTVIFETRLSLSQAEFFNHKSITVRTTRVVSTSLWTRRITDHEDSSLKTFTWYDRFLYRSCANASNMVQNTAESPQLGWYHVVIFMINGYWSCSSLGCSNINFKSKFAPRGLIRWPQIPIEVISFRHSKS